MRSSVVAGLLIVTTSYACTNSDSSSGVTPAIRDSSGITVIDYESTSIDALPIWYLDSTPTRLIGRTGTQSEEFYLIRGLVELPNGNVAVANGGSNEILWFGPGGDFIRSSGRSGDGPGEFRGLTGLTHAPSDSILAYDSSLRRFQVFDSAGRYTRGFALDDSERLVSSPEILTISATGRMVIRDLRLNAPEASVPGPVRLKYDILLFDRAGFMLDSITSPSAWEAFNPEPVNGVRVSTLAVPFGFNTLLAGTAEHLVLYDTETNRIKLLSLEGRVERILRPPVADPIDVSPADKEAYLDRALANVPPAAKATFTDIYTQIPVPTTKPRIRWLKAARSGALWIVAWPAADVSPSDALIFDRDWTLSARLRLPPGFEPFVVFSNRVIGVLTTSSGVEQVHEYRVKESC